MPYIKQADRPFVEPVTARPAQNAGELNYQFTVLAKQYVRFHGISYQRLNDVKGALQGALAEFDRRVVAPYEDTKIQENGDVY